MQIRADLSQRALVNPDDWQWVDSPQRGVRRVMLDRQGDEVAVATSFVRYAPESRFPGHDHARGEEFLVLEGEFADEHGRYPPGTYIRNPPGSHHAPFSYHGCLIWVKLRQFHPEDGVQMALTLDSAPPTSGQRRRLLHEHGDEQVMEITASGGSRIELEAQTVAQEVLVLEGRLTVDGSVLEPLSWLRVPAGEGRTLISEAACRLFWKTRPNVDWDD